MRLVPRVRALILQPIAYNTQFFNAIAESGLVSLEVFYLLDHVRTTNQFFTQQIDEHFVAHRLGLRQWSGLPVGWNRNLVGSPDWDVFWSGGYYYPPILGANFQLSLQDRPWMVWSDTPQLDKPMAGWKRVIKNMILSWTFHHADVVLATGERGVQAITALGAPPEKTRSLPYYVDQQRMTALARSRQGEIEQLRSGLIEQDTPILFFAGQLIERKGVDVLLEAALRLARRRVAFHLVLAGEGPLRTQAEEAARTIVAPGRISVLGFLNPEAVQLHMAASDFLVLPSRFDAYGVVVLEAQALGLPVILTTACAAAAERVEDDVEGLVITADEVDALAGAMERLCLEPETRRRMRIAALQKAQQHGVQSGVERLVDSAYAAIEHAGKRNGLQRGGASRTENGTSDAEGGHAIRH